MRKVIEKGLVSSTLGLHSAEWSESSSSDSPRERDAGVRCSSEHPTVAIVETTSRSTYKKDRDEK